jgi:hypothetical protein
MTILPTRHSDTDLVLGIRIHRQEPLATQLQSLLGPAMIHHQTITDNHVGETMVDEAVKSREWPGLLVGVRASLKAANISFTDACDSTPVTVSW